jgi:hypothetical protein
VLSAIAGAKKLNLASRQCPRLAFESTTTRLNSQSSNCGSAAALRPLIGRASGPRGSRSRLPTLPSGRNSGASSQQREAARFERPGKLAFLPVFGFLRWQQGFSARRPLSPWEGSHAQSISTGAAQQSATVGNVSTVLGRAPTAMSGARKSRWFAKRQNAAQRRRIICDDNCWRAC